MVPKINTRLYRESLQVWDVQGQNILQSFGKYKKILNVLANTYIQCYLMGHYLTWFIWRCDCGQSLLIPHIGEISYELQISRNKRKFFYYTVYKDEIIHIQIQLTYGAIFGETNRKTRLAYTPSFVADSQHLKFWVQFIISNCSIRLQFPSGWLPGVFMYYGDRIS